MSKKKSYMDKENIINEGIIDKIFDYIKKRKIRKLEKAFRNQYQLQNTSIKISSKSNNAISSIDIRKLNIYSLNKKAQKQISNLADIDNDYFIKNDKSTKIPKS